MSIVGAIGVREDPFNHLVFINSRRGQKPRLGLPFHHEDETNLVEGDTRGSGITEVQKHIKALKDESEYVRERAAMALGEIGEKAALVVPALTEALKDKSGDVRGEAALALGGIGKEAALAVPALTEALKDKDENVRVCAAFALGEIGKKAAPAVPALTEALKDESRYVRTFAVLALRIIGAKNP